MPYVIAGLAVAAGIAGWTVMQQTDLVAGLRGGNPTQVSAPDGPAPEAEPSAPPAFDAPPPDTDTRDGFLAAFGADRACSYATRITAGADVGRIAVLAGPGTRLTGLPGAYGEAFGVTPDVIDGTVTAAQCPALDLARGLQGRTEVAPTLVLDTAETAMGGTVQGRVGQVRGRGVWLALVTAEGQVFDLSSRLEPQADGSFLFAFTLNAVGVTEPQPQLLLALTATAPLTAVATSPEGAAAADLLARVLPEASGAGGVAQLARFTLTP